MSRSEPSSPNDRAIWFLRKVLPLFVVVAAFWWLFRGTNVDELLLAFRNADWRLFWGGMFALSVVLFGADTVAVWWVYRRYHAPHITIRDVLPARGASYFIGIVNYAAGGAAMALFFKRRFGVGALEGSASIFLLMLLDLAIVGLAVIVGGSFLPPEWMGSVHFLTAAFILGAIAHVVFWRAPWSWGALERVRNIQMFSGFRKATVADYLTLGAIRMPITLLYIVMHALTMSAFGIEVPFIRLFVYVPIQMLVAALPISVSGLGTVNAVQAVLFEPYAAHETIVAHGLAQFFGFNVPRFFIGLLFMREFSRILAEPAKVPDDDSRTDP